MRLRIMIRNRIFTTSSYLFMKLHVIVNSFMQKTRRVHLNTSIYIYMTSYDWYEFLRTLISEMDLLNIPTVVHRLKALLWSSIVGSETWILSFKLSPAYTTLHDFNCHWDSIQWFPDTAFYLERTNFVQFHINETMFFLQ